MLLSLFVQSFFPQPRDWASILLDGIVYKSCKPSSSNEALAPGM